MEELFLLIQQIFRDLNILSNYPPGEREELGEGYFQFLDEIRDIIRTLSRIVGGSTYWGWKVEWGCQPWHLMTYQQQKGRTLQAGWEDRLDFGLDVYRDSSIASSRILTSSSSFEVLTLIDLDALEAEASELEPVTDVCEAGNIQHEELVVSREFIPLGSKSSSDLDSLPELEDETDSDPIEIPWW